MMGLLYQHVVLALFVSSSIAPPVSPAANDKEQPPNCTNVAAISSPDARCWDQLGIIDYLIDPNTGWNKTTPTCATATTDATNCCRPGEFWASCFLRLATGSTKSCGDRPFAATASCYASNQLGVSPSIDPAIADQVGYVLRTIQNINNFFLILSNCKSDETRKRIITSAVLFEERKPSG